MIRLVIFFFPFCILQAASMENPSFPALLQKGFFVSDRSGINLRLGSKYIYTANQKLILKKYDFLFKPNIESENIAAILNINVKERSDLYLDAASAKFTSTLQGISSTYDMKSRKRAMWESGIKVVLIEVRDLSVGIDAKYLYFSSISPIKRGDAFEDGKAKLKFKEWQVGVGLSQKIGFFVPYVGIVHRNVNFKLKKLPFFEKRQLQLKQRKKTGIVIGTSLSANIYGFLNVEIHFINEKAISTSCEFRF